MQNRNVADVVFEQAAVRPAAVALIQEGRVLGFRELAEAVGSMARQLSARGIAAGQVVGVSMGQTALHLITQFALAEIGAVSCPVHPLIPEDRRRLAVQRFGVQCILSGRDELRLGDLPFMRVDAAMETGYDGGRHPMRIGGDAPFRIALSSGTSGDPKGVLYSHEYMLDRMRKSNYACTPLSRLIAMDFNFPIGFAFAMGMLAAGGAVIIPRSMGMPDIADAVRSHAATHWLLSPAQASALARQMSDPGLHFPTVEHLRIVGSTPDVRLLRTLREKFTPNVFVPYGSTEMGPVSIATPQLLATHPDSAGRLFPWAEAEVVDEALRPVPAGTRGRLRLRVERMPDGYHLDPEHTARRFQDGWYYPGDLARIDSEGLLYIDGREDDVLVVAGTKLRPDDIEQALLEHPAVSEAGVAVISDAGEAELLVAAVLPFGQADMAELRQFAAARLGPLAPRHLFQVRDLPRNTNGKLLRDRLARELQQALAEAAGSIKH